MLSVFVPRDPAVREAELVSVDSAIESDSDVRLLPDDGSHA
jgi:hypothetical protein